MGIVAAAPLDYEVPSFRAFVRLTVPLMLTLCVTNLVGLCDRFFLARGSMADHSGYVSGFIAAYLFQAPLTRFTTLGQSFVSYYANANERHRIGESVWQMIWFSLLSMLAIIPIGYIAIPYVFEGSSVQAPATTYFTCMLWVTFLFPLQAALTSFFIGQKKTKIVLITTLCAQCLHVLLDYLLIIGVDPYIPSMGVLGAAIALIVNQTVVCLTLLCLFLSKSQRSAFGTSNYRFNWKVFSAQMRAGLPLAVAPLISIASWVAVSRIMALQGGDYMTIFSIGSTLTVCFAFMNDALFQSVMTVVSGMLGGKNFAAIKRVIIHALYVLCTIMLLLAVPFLIMPERFLTLLFSTSSQELFSIIGSSSWLYLFCEGLLFIGMGLLAATRQTLFFIFTGALQWLTLYLPVFIIMGLWKSHPGSFWILISANATIIASLYFSKARRVISRSFG